MNEVKFVDYQETPGEKSLGIVTIEATGTFRLRYKMNAGKNGGSFPNPPSYKDATGEYISAVIPESNFMAENIKECIKAGMNKSQSPSPSPAIANPYKSTYVTTPIQEEIPF
jgi:hypothetical protein